LDEEAASRLFTLPGRETGNSIKDSVPSEDLQNTTLTRQTLIQRGISERNARLFEIEADKLDGWADDLKLGLEREIKDLDRQIKETRRSATTALTLEEKLAGQKQIRALELQRHEKRRALFDAQDQVDKQRDELIAQIEGKLKQTVSLSTMLLVRWKVS
jgi:adenine-specific DNA-methyltransferase